MQYLSSILNMINEMIKEAGKNPLSFIAYLLFIVAVFFIAFKICEYQVLLKNIQKLPQKDRLKALKEVSNKIKLKGGLTPELWMKNRCYNYIFFSFLIFLGIATVIFSIYFLGFGSVYGVISLFEQPEVSIADSNLASSDFLVTYKKSQIEKGDDEIDNNAFFIIHEFKYLSALKNQSFIAGVQFPPNFILQEPVLKIEVINNSFKTVTIDDVAVKIIKNEISTRPVPIFTFTDDEYLVSRLINIDSGAMFNTNIKYGIFLNSDCSDFSSDIDVSESSLIRKSCEYNREFDSECIISNKLYERKIDKMENFSTIKLKPILTPDYVNFLQQYSDFSGYCCLVGTLSYSDIDNNNYEIPFKCPVNTGGMRYYPTALQPSDSGSDLNLKAGVSDIEELVHVGLPVNHKKPEDIKLKVTMDRSAKVTMQISLITNEGKRLPVGIVVLDYFKPKESSFH